MMVEVYAQTRPVASSRELPEVPARHRIGAVVETSEFGRVGRTQYGADVVAHEIGDGDAAAAAQ